MLLINVHSYSNISTSTFFLSNCPLVGLEDGTKLN